MAPGDLTFVQRVLLDTLEAHKQHNPQNARKYDEVRPKFNELFLQVCSSTLVKLQHICVGVCNGKASAGVYFGGASRASRAILSRYYRQ